MLLEIFEALATDLGPKIHPKPSVVLACSNIYLAYIFFALFHVLVAVALLSGI